MPEPAIPQQLLGSTLSANIGEPLAARTKDPLWFLARQWQSGEFEAENGGRLAYVSASSREHEFEALTIGTMQTPVNLDDPLEALIERESANGDAPAWRAAALEYAFAVDTASHRFTGRDYHGRALDWYHLEVTMRQDPVAAAVVTRQIVPTQVHVPGAPHPRWWRFEDGNAYFDAPSDPEPNVLSLLLPEFAYLDINNWFVVPLHARAGTVREITALQVVDSFGVVTTLRAADQATRAFRLFAVDTIEGASAAQWGGEFLLLPNVAIDIVHNDDIEDIRFLRDENANLVWAVESRYRAIDGSAVINGDGVPLPQESPSAGDNLDQFRLMSPLPEYWIPYVPQQLSANAAVSGEIQLRRARTNPQATATEPQYRSKIVSESVTLLEEEIPRSGLRVRRISRFARGSDGTAHFWTGRLKEAGQRPTQPGLRFDFVDEK
jgi:hypothetical protein